MDRRADLAKSLILEPFDERDLDTLIRALELLDRTSFHDLERQHEEHGSRVLFGGSEALRRELLARGTDPSPRMERVGRANGLYIPAAKLAWIDTQAEEAHGWIVTVTDAAGTRAIEGDAAQSLLTQSLLLCTVHELLHAAIDADSSKAPVWSRYRGRSHLLHALHRPLVGAWLRRLTGAGWSIGAVRHLLDHIETDLPAGQTDRDSELASQLSGSLCGLFASAQAGYDPARRRGLLRPIDIEEHLVTAWSCYLIPGEFGPRITAECRGDLFARDPALHAAMQFLHEARDRVDRRRDDSALARFMSSALAT